MLSGNTSTNTTKIIDHGDHFSCDDSDIAFSYKAINNITFNYAMIYLDQFEAVFKRKKSAFIYLRYLLRNQSNILTSERGWKFHISLANVNSNIENGWNIIQKHLIKHKVYETKVIRDNIRDAFSKVIDRYGREVTIYAFLENRLAADWQNLLNDITLDLTQNSIKPGPLAPDDIEITGSNYISYRNDKIDYRSNVVINPFITIKIDVQNQLPRIASQIADEFEEDETQIQQTHILEQADEKNTEEPQSQIEFPQSLIKSNPINISSNKAIDSGIDKRSSIPNIGFFNNRIEDKHDHDDNKESLIRHSCYRHCVLQ